MEIEKLKEVEKFAENLTSMNYFKKLKDDAKGSVCVVNLEFSSYVDLMCKFYDLIKVAMLVLEGEEDGSNGTYLSNPNITVVTILDIALQLMPLSEAEALNEMANLRRSLLAEKTVVLD